MPSIDVGGTRVAYATTGVGEPVVALHSSASSSAQWGGLGEWLVNRHRVLAPDLYGYGETGRPRRQLTLADDAAIVAALVSRCDGPIHLVGHSYGGAVALRAALDDPERLSSLTLIEPVAFSFLRDDVVAERACFSEIAELAGDIAWLVENGDDSGGMARFVDYWSGQGTWSRARIETRAALSRYAGKVTSDFQATTTAPMPLDDFRKIGVPTLVLRGDSSPLPTRRIAELLAATLPNARLVTVDGAGHMLPLTHRDVVNELISNHLRTKGTKSLRRARPVRPVPNHSHPLTV